jgi:plasmid stabilization system protein ParE
VAQVRWTLVGKTTLAAIIRHRRDRVGFMAARTLHQTITQRVFLLKEFPELGQRMQESPGDDRRELIVSMYRVVYRVVGDTVTVLAIVDARHPSLNDEEGDVESR